MSMTDSQSCFLMKINLSVDCHVTLSLFCKKTRQKRKTWKNYCLWWCGQWGLSCLRETLLLCLHFDLALPHKSMDYKLNSGIYRVWEQGNLISFRALIGHFLEVLLLLVTKGFWENQACLKISEPWRWQFKKIMSLNHSHYMSSQCRSWWGLGIEEYEHMYVYVLYVNSFICGQWRAFMFHSHQHNSYNFEMECAWRVAGHTCHFHAPGLYNICTLVWGLYRHTGPQSQMRVLSPDRHHCMTLFLKSPWRHGTVQGCGQSRGSWYVCGQMCHRTRDSARSHLKKRQKKG